MQQEVKKQHTYNILNEELMCYIKICQEKKNQINTTLQTVLESCNKIEIEIVEIQNKTLSAANNAKQKFFNLAEQVTDLRKIFSPEIHRRIRLLLFFNISGKIRSTNFIYIIRPIKK